MSQSHYFLFYLRMLKIMLRLIWPQLREPATCRSCYCFSLCSFLCSFVNIRLFSHWAFTLTHFLIFHFIFMLLPPRLSLRVCINLPTTAHTHSYTQTHTWVLSSPDEAQVGLFDAKYPKNIRNSSAVVCGTDVLFNAVWVSKEALVRVDVCERKQGGEGRGRRRRRRREGRNK